MLSSLNRSRAAAAATWQNPGLANRPRVVTVTTTPNPQFGFANVTNLVLEEKIGSGGHGDVYRGYQEKFPQQKYAVKVEKFGVETESRLIEDTLVIRQKLYRIQQRLPLTSRPIAASIEWISVMRLACGPDFATFMTPPMLEKIRTTFSGSNYDRFILSILRDILSEVAPLHSEGLVHWCVLTGGTISSDIKEANLIIDVVSFDESDRTRRLRLLDMSSMAQVGTLKRAFRGTSGYVPPEIDNGEFGQVVTSAVDIFQIGVVLAQIIESAMDAVPRSTLELINAMLSRDPNHRPTITRLIDFCDERFPGDDHWAATQLSLVFAENSLLAGGEAQAIDNIEKGFSDIVAESRLSRLMSQVQEEVEAFSKPAGAPSSSSSSSSLTFSSPPPSKSVATSIGSEETKQTETDGGSEKPLTEITRAIQSFHSSPTLVNSFQLFKLSVRFKSEATDSLFGGLKPEQLEDARREATDWIAKNEDERLWDLFAVMNQLWQKSQPLSQTSVRSSYKGIGNVSLSKFITLFLAFNPKPPRAGANQTSSTTSSKGGARNQERGKEEGARKGGHYTEDQAGEDSPTSPRPTSLADRFDVMPLVPAAARKMLQEIDLLSSNVPRKDPVPTRSKQDTADQALPQQLSSAQPRKAHSGASQTADTNGGGQNSGVAPPKGSDRGTKAKAAASAAGTSGASGSTNAFMDTSPRTEGRKQPPPKPAAKPPAGGPSKFKKNG